MSDAQRGNTTHGPDLDEQLKQETRGRTAVQLSLSTRWAVPDARQ